MAACLNVAADHLGPRGIDTLEQLDALYAEALMDLHPWDLWEHDGSPKEWTPEIVGLLEDVVASHPDHPLALHLYIHTVEASADPQRAEPHADRLRGLMPAAGRRDRVTPNETGSAPASGPGLCRCRQS